MKKLILIASLLIPYLNLSMNSSSTSNECFVHNNMIEVTGMFAITSIGFIWAVKKAYDNKQLKKDLEFFQTENQKHFSLSKQFAQANHQLYQSNQNCLATIGNLQNQNNALSQANERLRKEPLTRTNSNGKKVSFRMHDTQDKYDQCVNQDV